MNARVGVLLLLALAVAAAPAAASRLSLAGLGVDVCETYSSEECREHPDKCTPCRVRAVAAAAAPGAACHLPQYCMQRPSELPLWLPGVRQLTGSSMFAPSAAGLGPRGCVL